MLVGTEKTPISFLEEQKYLVLYSSTALADSNIHIHGKVRLDETFGMQVT